MRWNYRTTWLGCQFITEHHGHTFTPRGDFESSIHLLACFSEETGEPYGSPPHVKLRTAQQNSPRAVTWAQEWTMDPGAVRWQCYVLPRKMFYKHFSYLHYAFGIDQWKQWVAKVVHHIQKIYGILLFRCIEWYGKLLQLIPKLTLQRSMVQCSGINFAHGKD